jgi:undecaprenyl-diphosphatase
VSHPVQAIVLGIVQGLTEWLPISSTAHLILVPALLGWKDTGAAATAVMQLGTMAAVLVYFRRDLWAMTVAFLATLRPGADRSTLAARLGWAVVVGTIPIAVLGLAFRKHIEGPLRGGYVVAFAMIGMALMLWLAEALARHRRGIDEVQVRDGWIVGLAQAIALIPGASRSGSTLTGALFVGLDREAAARFSFLLSVPAVVLSGLLEMKDVLKPPPPGAMAWTGADLLLSTLVAGIVGYASIAFLLRYLRTHTTLVFILYRLLVGAAILYLLSAGILRWPVAP